MAKSKQKKRKEKKRRYKLDETFKLSTEEDIWLPMYCEQMAS